MACVEQDAMIREREREWGGGTDCEKKSFSSHLSTLNLSSCWAPDWLGADLHTQTRTKSSSTCWLNQASLQSLSCTQPHTDTHTHTHTHTCYYHTLIEHSRWGVHPYSEGGRLLLSNEHYGPFSALFFFLSFLSLYTLNVLFLNTRVKRVEYGGMSLLMASQKRGWVAGMRSGSFSPGPSMICNKNTYTNLFWNGASFP